jgi:lysosomal acid lipase/cholesteryl ester hydrolase
MKLSARIGTLPAWLDWYLWWQIIRLCATIIQQIFYSILFHKPSSDQLQKSSNSIEISQFLSNQGIPFEEHHVHTSDGFILVLFRLSSLNNPPVLLMHGLHQSCEAFAVLKEDSLPNILRQYGFDVWLGNVRGNKYSCKHKMWTPHDVQYWDFSIDEMASQDIPAIVDYILKHSQKEKLSYIGFSQGSGMGFAAFSSNSQLCSKISHFIALSPAAAIRGLKSPFLMSLISCSPDVLFFIFGKKCAISYVLFFKRVLPRNLFNWAVVRSCKILFGWDLANIDPNDRDIIFESLYSYCSVKSTVHWFQIMRSGRFQMYDDYKEHYYVDPDQKGHVTPRYPLERISCPLHIFYGERDLQLIDIDSLISQLPPSSKIYAEESYEHLDYIYCRNSSKNIFPRIVGILKDEEVL